ncbi:hypothetical protein ONZ45_g6030 [Pleurotus djamor]|nr:hypothetical protein ONZ45_g6030 [Pleurotus djamor]
MSPSYKQTTNPVVLKNEPLVFTQCIVDVSHFGVDKNGATVIMGFGSMSFVPHSLARYTLTSSDFLPVAELPNKLGWAGEANMYMLAKIAAILAMTGNPTLGLDDNGMSITLKRKKAPTTAKATEDNERHRPRRSEV